MLNELDVLSCDIQNAYLTVPCREKVLTVAGDEFGSDSGKIMIITRALYGLKSAGASFRAFLGEHLHYMGFRPCLADPDAWLRPAVKRCGFEYYEYVLTYIEDCLAISHNPEKTIKGIQAKFKSKNDKFAEPTDYLGATLTKMTTASGTECWTQSSFKYIMTLVQSQNWQRRGTSFHLNALRLSVQVIVQKRIQVLNWEQKDIGTTKN